MRKFWRNTHLWIGLTAGIVLVVIGLTGSAIVFYRYLDEQIYSEQLLIPEHEINATAERISLADALRNAEKLHPDGSVLGIRPPRHDHAPYIAYRFFKNDNESFTFTLIPIHPISGKVLGELIWGETVMTFLYKLHYTLTFGAIGALVVGFIGIFFLISLFSGLYLWWPKAGKWKQALWFKKNASSHRRNFDIHRVFGFYPMIILVVVAFSGIYMIFPNEIKWGVNKFMTLTPKEKLDIHLDSPVADGEAIITYEEALAIAREFYPTEKIRDFDRPHDSSHPFAVAFESKKQPMTSYGYDVVSIHPVTAEVLFIKRWSDTTKGDVFLGWQYPLHNGEAFGLVGRWIIFFSGFLPAILFTTGLLMWLKRRKTRK